MHYASASPNLQMSKKNLPYLGDFWGREVHSWYRITCRNYHGQELLLRYVILELDSDNL